VPAARQADVGTADPQPVVALRGGKHLVEQLAVGGLDRGAPRQRPVRLGDARGEGIAKLLELAEVKHPWRPHGVDPVRHVDPAEALGDEPRELQLQPSDLPPQLGPGKALRRNEPLVLGNPLGDKGQPVGLRPRLPFEQIRHGQILSGLEGRRSNP